MNNPSLSQLHHDLERGFVHLFVQYYKDTGKWYGSAWVKIPIEELKLVQFSHHTEFLGLIDKYQDQLQKNAYREFFVTINENHYDNIPGYNNFFTRLYHPEGHK